MFVRGNGVIYRGQKPASRTFQQKRTEQKAPRKRFMAEKLKDAATRDEISQELERRSPATLAKVLQLKDQHTRLVLSTQTFIDRSHALVVEMMQEVAAQVLSSPNPVQHTGGQPTRPRIRERNHQASPSQNTLHQKIQRQKNFLAELQSHEPTGPDDPVLARLEAERLRLHDLKLKLTVAKQMEVDRDIANTTKEVSVQLDKDQLQTAWGLWRHFRSSRCDRWMSWTALSDENK